MRDRPPLKIVGDAGAVACTDDSCEVPAVEGEAAAPPEADSGRDSADD
jgi:hypothetical protein